jgi:hypothetical protein
MSPDMADKIYDRALKAVNELPAGPRQKRAAFFGIPTDPITRNRDHNHG